MSAELGLIALLSLLFGYALIGHRLSSTMITAPMIFLLGGYWAYLAGIVDTEGAEHNLSLLAEVALIVLLFADAAMINPKALIRGAAKPARMLLIGLPLMVLFGFLAGELLLPGWPIWEIALLAALLAPTDAALGQAVITNPAIPEPMRRTLSAESGLNDGLALPFVVFFGCLAVGGVHDEVQVGWGQFVGQQVGFGVLAGLCVGAVGGWLLRQAQNFHYTNNALGGIAVLTLSGLAYLFAHELHGNGFIAAFIAGLTFGQVLRNRSGFVFEFIETEGQLLMLLAFFAIGALLIPIGLSFATPALIALVALSLFVLRPAAIWISLMGSGASRVERAFFGWFGPRGLATALFALLALGAFEGLRMREEILAAAAVAVMASAVLHGASAAPAGRWFERHHPKKA
ncbi:MAG: cation:proton antiporter [Pseudomonadota bacterium]